MKPDTIRTFAISKLGWIKQQQRKLRQQERETAREYLERESQYVWGKRYLLEIIESDETPSPARADAQRPLHRADGSTDAAMALSPRAAQSVAGAS